ncbi:hypothetical protein HGB07_01130 [Candidatus Roizmanbacteria bacterium]|nr:hypothetical protein [Candidatus Roizmanbacteria bacterium]
MLEVNKYFKKNKTAIFVSVWLLLVLMGSIFFYVRYQYAYNNANFFAEDGVVFFRNITIHGALDAMFTLFNGYLVTGQYVLTGIAIVLNSIFGRGLETMPKAMAVVSYVFLGFISSLPFLLFRKKLGYLLATMTAILLWVVPLGGYDYTVIGTICNLKFSFFFIAALLIIYRNQKDLVDKKWQFIIIDLTLLLCVITNILTIALLPFLFWRYKNGIIETINNRAIKKLSAAQISAAFLVLLTILYLLLIAFRHTKSMPGYLDEPLMFGSIINIFSRGSIYGLLFPVNNLLNDYIVIFFFIVSIVAALLSRYRAELLFIWYAIFINVAGFVYNRTGVTHMFSTYASDGGPGLFFYAGTMLFVFGVAYSTQDWFRRQKIVSKIILAALAIGFIMVSLPTAGSRGASYTNIISKRPTISAEIIRVCANASDENVEIGIYPSVEWTLTVERRIACTRD